MWVPIVQAATAYAPLALLEVEEVRGFAIKLAMGVWSRAQSRVTQLRRSFRPRHVL